MARLHRAFLAPYLKKGAVPPALEDLLPDRETPLRQFERGVRPRDAERMALKQQLMGLASRDRRKKRPAKAGQPGGRRGD